MKANFDAVNFNSLLNVSKEDWLNERAEILALTTWVEPGNFREESSLPDGFDNYHCIDVLGKEFIWVNENFPKEHYKWYLWFESIFLVPPEMATFLKLRWLPH